MTISINDKCHKELNCLKIEINAKPNLLTKVLNKPSTLLIVVDMVVGFCTSGNMASSRGKSLVPQIVRLVDTLTDCHRVYINDSHESDSVELKFFPEHCHNERESAVVAELADYEHDTLLKNSTNGFFALIGSDIDLGKFSNIVIVGLCSDICILQLSLTLRAYLNERNMVGNVITFTDCIDTYDAPNHNADLHNLLAISNMELNGIQVFKNII